MDTAEIYSRLNEIFRDIFDDENIVLNPGTTANDIKDWDSLNHINLIVAIEASFRIKFKTAELESLHTVGHLVDVVERKLSAAA